MMASKPVHGRPIAQVSRLTLPMQDPVLPAPRSPLHEQGLNPSLCVLHGSQAATKTLLRKPSLSQGAVMTSRARDSECKMY